MKTREANGNQEDYIIKKHRTSTTIHSTHQGSEGNSLPTPPTSLRKQERENCQPG